MSVDGNIDGIQHLMRGIDFSVQNLHSNDRAHAQQASLVAETAFGGACQRAFGGVVQEQQGHFNSQLVPGMQQTVDSLSGVASNYASGQDLVVGGFTQQNYGVGSVISGTA